MSHGGVPSLAYSPLHPLSTFFFSTFFLPTIIITPNDAVAEEEETKDHREDHRENHREDHRVRPLLSSILLASLSPLPPPPALFPPIHRVQPSRGMSEACPMALLRYNRLEGRLGTPGMGFFCPTVHVSRCLDTTVSRRFRIREACPGRQCLEGRWTWEESL